MFMGHRQSEDGLQATETIGTPWEAALWWEFFQAYMDTSRPLPDIPEHEPFRHQDPVTAEYDKRTGRDPHYWRNVGTQRAEAMKKKARKRAKAALDGDYLWMSQPLASMEQ